MRKIFFVIFLLSNSIIYCQENDTQKKSSDNINFTFKTDQEPYYPKGDAEFITFFYKNIKFSDEAIDNKLSGEVMVSFDVMPDSTLADINILKGVDSFIDAEVLRILKEIKYAPGIIDGEKAKMNVILYIPIKAQ